MLRKRDLRGALDIAHALGGDGPLADSRRLRHGLLRCRQPCQPRARAHHCRPSGPQLDDGARVDRGRHTASWLRRLSQRPADTGSSGGAHGHRRAQHAAPTTPSILVGHGHSEAAARTQPVTVTVPSIAGGGRLGGHWPTAATQLVDCGPFDGARRVHPDAASIAGGPGQFSMSLPMCRIAHAQGWRTLNAIMLPPSETPGPTAPGPAPRRDRTRAAPVRGRHRGRPGRAARPGTRHRAPHRTTPDPGGRRVAGQYAELQAAGCIYASQRGRIRSGNRQFG